MYVCIYVYDSASDVPLWAWVLVWPLLSLWPLHLHTRLSQALLPATMSSSSEEATIILELGRGYLLLLAILDNMLGCCGWPFAWALTSKIRVHGEVKAPKPVTHTTCAPTIGRCPITDSCVDVCASVCQLCAGRVKAALCMCVCMYTCIHVCEGTSRRAVVGLGAASCYYVLIL